MSEVVEAPTSMNEGWEASTGEQGFWHEPAVEEARIIHFWDVTSEDPGQYYERAEVDQDAR